jgi:hypothetical protein
MHLCDGFEKQQLQPLKSDFQHAQLQNKTGIKSAGQLVQFANTKGAENDSPQS